MKVYKIWFYHGTYNFGDQLSLLILNHFGKSRNIQFVLHKNKKTADIIGIGSILHSIPPQFRGYIWSTGSLNMRTSYEIRDKSKVFGLRGPLTARKFNCPGAVLGDGALILPFAFPEKVESKFRLGIIPHYVDHDYITSKVSIPSNVLVINVTHPVRKVIQQIKECACIISSSLHGLIVADAFNIPNRQFRVSTSHKIRGDMFKYKDYYASIGIKQPRFVRIKPSTDLLKTIIFTNKYYKRERVPEVQAKVLAELNRFFESVKV